MRPSVPGPRPRSLRNGNIVSWSGSELGGSNHFYRLYHRDSYCSDPTEFRSFGPVSRYDHHDKLAGVPTKSARRKSAYFATSVGTAVAEVFGDTPVGTEAMVCEKWFLARVQVTSPIWMFDLTEAQVMRAGAVATIIALDRDDSQEWAKAIYKEHTKLGGILYVGSHDYGKCFVLRDKVRDKIEVEVGYDRQPWDYPIMNLPLGDGIRQSFDQACTERHISLKKIAKTDCPICADPARHP